MNKKEVYETLKKVLVRGGAIGSAAVFAVPAIAAVKQTNVVSEYNGMSLANMSDTDLFSLLMNTAKAESNKDAIIDQMQKKMKEKFGEVITSREGLWNLYLYCIGNLDEENKNATIDLASVIIAYSSFPNNGIFSLSEYVRLRDSFLADKLKESEDLTTSLKSSKNGDAKQALMDRMVNPPEGLDADIDILANIYSARAGAMYLGLDDSIDGYAWIKYNIFGKNGEVIEYNYRGYSKGKQLYEAEKTKQELKGTGLKQIYSLQEIEAMILEGKAEIAGLVRTLNDRIQILVGNPEKGCIVIN